MYCSDECELKAFEEYHRYECESSDTLSKCSETLKMAIHCFFIALAYCNDSITELQNLIGKPATALVTVFDHDYANPNDHTKTKNDLLVLMSSNYRIPSKTDSINVFTLDFMASHSVLSKATKVEQDFIITFIRNAYLIGPKNLLELRLHDSNLKNHELVPVAAVYCPTLSVTELINVSFELV